MNRNEFIKTLIYNLECHKTMVQINNSKDIPFKMHNRASFICRKPSPDMLSEVSRRNTEHIPRPC